MRGFGPLGMLVILAGNLLFVPLKPARLSAARRLGRCGLLDNLLDAGSTASGDQVPDECDECHDQE